MHYSPKSDHRQASAAQKSQWTISEAEELACFQLAATSQWTCRACYWGVHPPAGPALYLGLSKAPEREPVFIAKFVEDQSEWHGYPVAHWRSHADKPGSKILKAWHSGGFIRKKTIKRVLGGRKCKP